MGRRSGHPRLRGRCLLYTSDAADDLLCVDLGGRRIIKKKIEKKAAKNAMDLMTRWPDEWVAGWVETMTGIARDEAAHLAQVTRILMRRGGRLTRGHRSSY